VLLAAALAAACTGGAAGEDDPVVVDRFDPNRGPRPSIVGGVALAAVDPATVLVGESLAYGAPLPSQEAAVAGMGDLPEVVDALARRVYATDDGRHLADLVIVTLDGAEIFDDAALGAYERAVVAGTAGVDDAAPVEVAGRSVLRADAAGVTALGYREGDLLVLVAGAAGDAVDVVTRQLQARATGAVGTLEPRTPIVATAIDAAYVEVPGLQLQGLPAPGEDGAALVPPVPVLPGAAALDGRFGVVAGERRVVVWVIALDPGAHPYAESVEPHLHALVSERAGGSPTTATELVDRVVVAADGPEDGRSARTFRHRGLVVLVEGSRPDQLDAVVTAWLTALGPG